MFITKHSNILMSVFRSRTFHVPDLRGHVSNEHCGYVPYECRLCLASGHSIHRVIEDKMKEHLWSAHKTTDLKYRLDFDELKSKTVGMVDEEIIRN